MTTTDAIKILSNFNKWRRGAETPQPSPALIGEAIDVACSALTFERTWIEGGMNPEDAPPLPWMKPFESPEQHEPGGEQIASATESFAGVDTDAYMNEVRGREPLKVYHFETTQFEAVVSCADLQGAMDLLFSFLINNCAFSFRFDTSNVSDVSDSDDWPVFEKAGVAAFIPTHK